MKPIAEQGYLIVAINVPGTNYVSCAETLAKTIKYWHPDAKICLLTNITDASNPVLFDYVREFPYLVDLENPWSNDWQVFRATPFRETIKLEADMMITSPIDHWWTMLRNRDVVVSTGCRDWKDQRAASRHYRKVFDANALPDVYNAITYYRPRNRCRPAQRSARRRCWPLTARRRSSASAASARRESRTHCSLACE